MPDYSIISVSYTHLDGFPVEQTISDGLGNWVENVPDLNIEDIENITAVSYTHLYGEL